MGDQRSFGVGTDVEARLEEPGREGFWYPAKILDVQPAQDSVYVQYDTLMSEADESQPLKAFVKLSNVRPRRPDNDYLVFEAGDRVDALYEDGWLEGTIKEAIEDGESEKFVVVLSRMQKEVVFEIKNLRHSSNPIDSQRTPKTSQILSGSSVMKFQKGMLVEVRGNSDAWFIATIIDAAGDNSFLLEHQHSKTDDGSELLKIIERSEHMRPSPPPLPVVTVSLHEKVDAWHKDAWRAGVISNVLEGPKYIVSFPSTNEETEFEPRYVRFRQEWIDGKWIKGSQIYSGVAWLFPPRVHDNVFRETSEMKFPIGMLVEVSDDEDGVSSAWFTATIVTAAGKNSFVVKYEHLKTDDGTELLTKTVDSERIRPFPPEVSVETFSLDDEVDARRDGGWWVGFISRILKGPKYIVYFPKTDEKIKFEPCCLRLHQEWINNEWIHAAQG